MNFAQALAGNRFPGIKVDPAKFSAKPAEAARQLLFRNPSPPTLASIEKAPAAQGDKNTSARAAVAGLILGSPDFQRR
jgi:hypothetical protein